MAYNGKPEQPVGGRDWDTDSAWLSAEPANRFGKERLYAELPKVKEAEAAIMIDGGASVGVQLYWRAAKCNRSGCRAEGRSGREADAESGDAKPAAELFAAGPAVEKYESAEISRLEVGRARRRSAQYKLVVESRKSVAG